MAVAHEDHARAKTGMHEVLRIVSGPARNFHRAHAQLATALEKCRSKLSVHCRRALQRKRRVIETHASSFCDLRRQPLDEVTKREEHALVLASQIERELRCARHFRQRVLFRIREELSDREHEIAACRAHAGPLVIERMHELDGRHHRVAAILVRHRA